MLFSRFWYFILAVLASAGVAAALLTATLVNEQRRESVEDDLYRDRAEVDQTLRIEARRQLDGIAGIAANGDIRSALRQASARRPGEAVPEETVTRLRAKLSELNQQLGGLRGELMFAVDSEGMIVAAIAPGRVPDAAGLGHFPLVRRALEGYMRDDVWIYNDGVYRMAARPVIEAGQYVGALIHGKRFDDTLAELLSTRLRGATIGFFYSTSMFASYMPTDIEASPRRDDVAAPLAEVLTDEHLLAGDATEPQELPTGGLAVYSLVTGTARDASVGYAIARPVPVLEQPWVLLVTAPSQSIQSLLGSWWWLFVLILLGTFIVAMFSVWVERDRPLANLHRATKGLSGNPENRLTVTDFGGRHRKIAQAFNETLDQALAAVGAVGPKRKAANLDEILGPTTKSSPGGAFFGFAQQDQGHDLPEVPPATSSPAAPPRGAGFGTPPPGMGPPAASFESDDHFDVPPAAPPSRPPASSLGAPPVMPPSPSMPRPPGPPPPGMGAKPPLPKPPVPGVRMPGPPTPSQPMASPAAAAVPSPMQEPPTGFEATPLPGPVPNERSEVTAAASPSAEQRKNLKRTLLGVAPPEEPEEEEDGQTMVARVPEELIAQSAALASAADAAEEEQHFREVFEKFVETKKQCGEPTAGLTFEKFLVTLRKNRDQIVSRHGARKVRFTVYVKGGKAALKATPIRD